MHPSASPQIRSGLNRPSLRPLAIALMLTTTLALHRAPAAEPVAVPPSFPDAAHVVNGCYLSTATYIARFTATFPGETAVPVAVTMLNADGRRHAHTMTLLTWRGEWWGRDEYFGVFALNRPVADGQVTSRVVALAEARLEQHARRLVSAGGLALPKPASARLGARQCAHEIATARALLPFATEQFWVTSHGEEIPFLFFHPAEGEIAVYTPKLGTASACCALTDGAQVVALVAARLGYAVGNVRRAVAPSLGQTFAGTEMKGALVR